MKKKKIINIVSLIILFVVICFLVLNCVTTKNWTGLVVLICLCVISIVWGMLFDSLDRKKRKQCIPRTRAEIVQYIKGINKLHLWSERMFDLITLDAADPNPRSYYERDLYSILQFDRCISRGGTGEVPALYTDEGKKLWKQYMDAYAEEQDCAVQADKKSIPPSASGWRCTCGRENPNYTSTCVCGINRRGIRPT